MTSRTTPATEALTRAGLAFETVTYDYDPGTERVGLQAAQALGVPAGQVFKTLMVLVDNQPCCAVLSSDGEVNMKKLSAALGGKSAEMMKPADAERLTGYKIGGISPFGQKRAVPTAMDELALLYECIYLNGGRRGLQIVIAPEVALNMLDARLADIRR